MPAAHDGGNPAVECATTAARVRAPAVAAEPLLITLMQSDVLLHLLDGRDLLASARTSPTPPASTATAPQTRGGSPKWTPPPSTSHHLLLPPPPLRPYTPHSDAPSSIHPIPIHNGPPTTLHCPVSIPPDGWIPLAQDDTAGSGRLSIFLPPPHELSDVMRSQDVLDVLQNSAPPSPAPSRLPSPMLLPGFMHGHKHHPRLTQMQALVPIALVPQ
ncbi:hypothetical protein OF83DRAFT_1180734, partial [Amylostereum chailletii]